MAAVEPGARLAHYRLVEKIGAGGMGEVWKAHDTRLDRTVALKFLPASFATDPERVARFEREARAVAALNHPGIVTIYAVERVGELRFLAMEWVAGETLESSIPPNGLALERLLELAAPLLDAVEAAHRAGVIHRDLKPANVVIGADGRLRVLDFGLAKLRPVPGDTDDDTRTQTLTRTGTVFGTLAYMAPEALSGRPADTRSDIFSLGVVLYEMAAGRRPFAGATSAELASAILRDTPAPLAAARPDLPLELRATIERCLHKDAGRRYASASELRRELEKLRPASSGGHEAGTGRRSVAVLPFADMSPQRDQEYFCEGMSEELINALTQLRGLRVAARTSAFSFRGRDLDVREIGRKLDVDTVLEGSVRKAGNRLRITVQLIDVANGYHLWSDRFDRELEDVFAIQDEIARAVADRLAADVVPQAGAPLVKRYTDDLEAYGLFLDARYHLYKLTPEGWRKSLELYRAAIARDANFAPAYSDLSIHYQSQAFWSDVPAIEVMEESRRLARRALELDDTLVDAHSALGVIHFSHDWDWSAGERELQRALELEPSNAMARCNHAIKLALQGQTDAALAEGALAVRLDPFSSMIHAWAGSLPYYVGRAAEAIDHLSGAIERDPGYWQLHLHLGAAYMHAERFGEAAVAAARAVELSGGASVATAWLACAELLAGETASGEAWLQELEARDRRGHVAPTLLAWVRRARGDLEGAVSELERAVQARDPWVVFGRVIPCLRIPGKRAAELLARVGLPASPDG